MQKPKWKRKLKIKRDNIPPDNECLGEFNYVVCNTESQKSFATTAAYSLDFTDGSSGQESRGTYVLHADSDSDRDAPARALAAPPAPVVANDAISLQSTSNVSQRLPPAEAADDGRSADVSDALAEREAAVPAPEPALHAYSLISQETFTQTSKTIIELAQTNYVRCSTDTHAIETQTSHVSIVENKTIEYRIEVSGSQTRFTQNEKITERGRALQPGGPCPAGSSGGSSGTLRIVDDEPETTSSTELEPADNSSEENADTSKYDTDFTDSLEDDSRCQREHSPGDSDQSVAQSVDEDVEELYTNLEKSFDLRTLDRPPFDIPRYVSLSPLTEETIAKAESFKEASRRDTNKPQCEEFISRNERLMKPPYEATYEVKLNKVVNSEDGDREPWKLPPIQCQQRRGRGTAAAAAAARVRDAGRGDPAAGEGAALAATAGLSACGQWRWLPDIRAPSPASRGDGAGAAPTPRPPPPPPPPDTISIHGNIQRLKMHPHATNKRMLYGSSTTESRSSSPGSASERRGGGGSGGGGGAGAAVTARACEALCADVIARLRHACSGPRTTFEQLVSRQRQDASDSCGARWEAAVEVLEDIPRLFRGFWRALPEPRVQHLLRLVSAQVESPRTRVARAACAAVAALLSNTNYTKKPEFEEAVAALLAKTGSMAGALQRAANLALDRVVAGVAPAPAITALCLFGTEHKSGLVRCAAARLLVVSAALAAGGRGVLVARPRSAAAARRLALRALADLLVDRCHDTRKYAERLYRLLRPLAGFEAFFLADVEARAACRLMRKFDALLLPAPAPAPPPPR